MPVNIELKARCADLDAAAEAARAIGAIERGILIQTDTYFHVPHGRLKLRTIEPDRAELIFYERADSAESRASRYVITPVKDLETMLDALQGALGVRGRVRKRRRLLLWHNVRIHLDDVHELGSFVEFEAVLSDGHTETEGHARVQKLFEALRLSRDDVQPGSYADLLALD